MNKTKWRERRGMSVWVMMGVRMVVIALRRGRPVVHCEELTRRREHLGVSIHSRRFALGCEGRWVRHVGMGMGRLEILRVGSVGIPRMGRRNAGKPGDVRWCGSRLGLVGIRIRARRR